jgi:hypothetical protein
VVEIACALSHLTSNDLVDTIISLTCLNQGVFVAINIEKVLKANKV